MAIEIARRCPQIPFRIVANASDEDVRREVTANLPPNVTLLDYVPFHELPPVFGSARIFLSTGNAQYEGFPTVLLHAVAAEKPIVSLQDFDGFLASSQSGVICGEDSNAAAEAINRYWNDAGAYDAAPALEYLRRNHAVDSITNRFAKLLADLDRKSNEHESNEHRLGNHGPDNGVSASRESESPRDP
jgi:hypothetical protein